MWYSLCVHDDAQIQSDDGETGWVHTVWNGIGVNPTFQEGCPTVPGAVATPSGGVRIEWPVAEGGDGD